ncbi:tRNA-specific adenosine deaminase [bacterium BMS3Bbin06]|nr:tRNA-specific adenosine deaminase [bacterium BMS3Abin08]GBE35117.1 tRNA-specific adenosine deaminase [bacterium BMS3Bbin06]HDO36467.1 nucleoside deaminase [Nitrospirota bacterium]HDY72129.1 nucleoside deaminase [Nitrospirota bacterium]
MELAVEEAAKAFDADEIPVGAVIVCGGQVVAREHNRKEAENNPVAHAELLAIIGASRNLGRWRLTDCTLYITKEPCPMCAGAIVNARIDRVVFGCMDEKGGAGGSIYNILQDGRLNHRVEVVSGLMADKSSELLKGFFRKMRSS